MSENADITQWLSAARDGDRAALDRVLSSLYRELHTMARRQLGNQNGQTLDATGLVHEAYLRLVGRADVQFGDRAHFFAYAASAMRSVVVDYARQRLAVKRGGDLHRVTDLPPGRLHFVRGSAAVPPNFGGTSPYGGCCVVIPHRLRNSPWSPPPSVSCAIYIPQPWTG